MPAYRGVLNNFILRDLFNVAMFLWICHLVIHVNRNITELNTSLKKSCSLRCPLILGKGSHPLHAEADLELLTNFLLIIENQNMSVTHWKPKYVCHTSQSNFLCRHVRDVSLMPAYRGVLNDFILGDLFNVTIYLWLCQQKHYRFKCISKNYVV